LEFDLGPLKAY
jgi:hypothetical protein